MMDTDQLLTILSANNLTHKDKIVFIAREIVGSDNPKTISDSTGISIQSVRQSLAKSSEKLLNDDAESEEVIDALIAVCHMDKQSMRQKDWSSLAKTASALVEAGATPEEVHIRANQYRRKFQGVTLTPSALDKYWAMLSARPTFTPGAIYR